MSKERVFVTGASGFLGAHLVAGLVESSYEVMASVRRHTDTWRCDKYHKKINWTTIGSENFKEDIISFNPEIIIHAAWAGVGAAERNDWVIQLENLQLLGVLFEISKQCRLKKMIALGSQAEYGNVNGKVSEDASPDAKNAYAVCKTASQQIMQAFCEQHGIAWYWLRIFSVFGPKEDMSWFIPAMILNQLRKKDSDLTWAEQRYDYLFAEDFSKMIMKVVASGSAASGIYNISSGQAVSLKEMVEKIAQLTGSNARLNFGAIPYRKDQSMHIEGDNKKFEQTFGELKLTGLDIALGQTINYYKKVLNTASKQEA